MNKSIMTAGGGEWVEVEGGMGKINGNGKI